MSIINCPEMSDSESDSSKNHLFLGCTLNGLGSDKIEELFDAFSFLLGALVGERMM